MSRVGILSTAATDTRTSGVNAQPDFTERRGRGCYENEVVNIFRLAIPDQKVAEPIDSRKLLRAERDRIAVQIRALRIPVCHGEGGSTAGWNAALEAALQAVSDG